jgi:hypothetical protein
VEWRLRLQGDVPAFEALLPEVNPHLRLTLRGGTDSDGFVELRLQAPMAEMAAGEALLRAAMRQDQWRVREFAHVEPGLEEIFMAATNQGLDETMAPSPRRPAR